MTLEKSIFITAPVMIPETPDCDYNRGEKLFSNREVEDFAHSFMKYRVIEENHDFFITRNQVGEAVESYVLTQSASKF